MRFGNCPTCNKYKYLENSGFCTDCLEKQDDELIDLIENASMKPEEIIENLQT